MIVKDAPSPLERMRIILESQNGTLLTADLAKFNIPRTYLAILERNGEIERVSRGVYQAKDAIEDELFRIQATCHSAVYSHETALYLHDLTDRSPLRFSLTVPVGYHSASLIQGGYKIFYVNRSMFDLGVITLKSPHGNSIRVTDLERTICDVLRSRNQMDMQIVYEALKRYVKRNEKDIDLLYAYAKRFRVQKIIRQYIEVLL
jgi:predicted transcriptional regulator of viral defense system